MSNPLDKLKRLRSWDEIVTRGGQAISAYREQKSGIAVPSDEEFVSLIDASQFGTAPIIAESLWQKFYKHGERCFFQSVRKPLRTGKYFRRLFGDAEAAKFIQDAEGLLDGRIRLLGLPPIDVGTDIDWHREPLSGKRSPLKHWKEFDDLDSSESGNKKILWELNRHQQFFTLGVAYVLTSDERFASLFAEQISCWMEQNLPAIGVNWSSSLEVAFRSMSWIWALHLFRESDALTPELFRRIVRYLYLHARHIEHYLSTYYSPNTHLTGEALGLYYLGTQLRFFRDAARWRKLGEDILFAEITKQILPDGVYFEQSTWYHRYTLDIFSQFTILRSLDQQADVHPRAGEFETRLNAAFDHAMHLTGPDGTTPLIGDDDGGRMLPLTHDPADDFRGTLAVGAVLLGNDELKFASGGLSEEVFWLMGPAGAAAFEQQGSALPRTASKGFRDGGYFVMRDGWEDTDNLLIVDCGNVGSLAGGHGHADALSIEVSIHGKPVLVDSGTYTYHASPDIRDYFRSSLAHNTLAVDGRSSSEPGSTFNWRTRAESTLVSWLTEDRFDLFEGSHDGYQRLDDPVTHRRSILALKNDYWIIRDTAETTGSHEYALNFHFAADVIPVIGDAGEWVGNNGHRIYTFGDHGQWERKESWISRSHESKVNAPYMRYVSDGVGTQEFFSFILPSDVSAEPPTVVERPIPDGRAFVIKFSGYTDVLLFNDEPGRPLGAGLFDSDFQYSWARLSGDDLPDELVLINGGKFHIGDTCVLEGDILSFASVRRFGNEFYLKTPAGRRKIQI